MYLDSDSDFEARKLPRRNKSSKLKSANQLPAKTTTSAKLETFVPAQGLHFKMLTRLMKNAKSIQLILVFVGGKLPEQSLRTEVPKNSSRFAGWFANCMVDYQKQRTRV